MRGQKTELNGRKVGGERPQWTELPSKKKKIMTDAQLIGTYDRSIFLFLFRTFLLIPSSLYSDLLEISLFQARGIWHDLENLPQSKCLRKKVYISQIRSTDGDGGNRIIALVELKYEHLVQRCGINLNLCC